MEAVRDNSEHYNTELYQESVRIERGCRMGVDPAEVYRRESEFTLRVANMRLGEGDRILDLASGAGNHIVHLDKQLGGKVHIDGVEKGDRLAAMANQALVDCERTGVRDRLNVHVGDMTDIYGALPDAAKSVPPKLIVCQGSSYMYLNKAKRRQSLQQVFNLLPAGGKLVLQWRQPDQELKRHKKAEIDRKNSEDGTFSIGEERRRGEIVEFLKDEKKGDGFYHYYADAPHPDEKHPDDYEEFTYTIEHGTPAGPQVKTVKCYREKGTNVIYSTFGRVYDPDFRASGDPAEREVDLGTTTVNEFTSKQNEEAMTRELEAIGFTGVRLHTDPAPIGFHKLYAVEATKPPLTISRDPAPPSQDAQAHIDYWQSKQ